MIEFITAKMTGEVVAYAGGGIAVMVSTWLLKRIPNDVIKAKVGLAMYGMGVGLTLGMSKWRYTKRIWNKTIEPYIIDAIDNILVSGLYKFVEGMRSDNEPDA